MQQLKEILEKGIEDIKAKLDDTEKSYLVLTGKMAGFEEVIGVIEELEKLANKPPESKL